MFGLRRRQGHWTDAIDRSAKGCKDRYSFAAAGGRIELALCMLKMIIALCYYFCLKDIDRNQFWGLKYAFTLNLNDTSRTLKDQQP